MLSDSSLVGFGVNPFKPMLCGGDGRVKTLRSLPAAVTACLFDSIFPFAQVLCFRSVCGPGKTKEITSHCFDTIPEFHMQYVYVERIEDVWHSNNGK